ncbi:MAG: (4Fe-4S)-binding protein [Dehalococcoidia bacterium]|nr:(4Fe-4S)-binding protein [Dehalococcoidia bacterium]
MPRKRIQRYEAGDLAVNFDPNLCVHAARCLQTLPGVFDVRRRDWVRPAEAPVAEVIATVRDCPSGALTYEHSSGPELPDPEPSARTVRDGPIYVRGAVSLRDVEGGVIAEGTRFALCRCGHSANKPFCDNSHRAAGFRAD